MRYAGNMAFNFRPVTDLSRFVTTSALFRMNQMVLFNEKCIYTIWKKNVSEEIFFA